MNNVVISSLIFFFLTFTFLDTASASNNKNYLDIAKLGHEQYQDIIIDDVVVQRATHNHAGCKDRYNIIKKILKRYKRPFTMLDIGASQGYYSFRSAADFPKAVCVMIEGNNPHYPLVGTQLKGLCKANNRLKNIIFLNKMVSVGDLEPLSQCEHFDVVLAMNIIHWFKEDWKRVVNSILKMGHRVIIETPPQEDCVNEELNALRRKIKKYLISKGAKAIAKVPRHTSGAMSTLYLCKGSSKHYLKKKTWILPPMKERTHEIVCTYKKKYLRKPLFGRPHKTVVSKWVAGINLLTFKMYCGSSPSKAFLKDTLVQLRNVPHNDWTINNIIIQGKKLVFIDYNDPEHDPGAIGGTRVCTDVVLAKHFDLIDIDDPELVQQFFWNKLLSD